MRVRTTCIGVLSAFAFVLLVSSQAAAQNERSELQLIWGPETWVYPDWIPWANGGDGDSGWITGQYSLWAKVVETPSGNLIMQGELRGYDEILTDGGELWKMIDYDNHIFYHYPKKYEGNVFIANQPIWCSYVNDDTGQVVRIKYLYHIYAVWDAGIGDYVWDMEKTFVKYQSWRFIKQK